MASLDGSRHDNGELINSNVRPPAETQRNGAPVKAQSIRLLKTFGKDAVRTTKTLFFIWTGSYAFLIPEEIWSRSR